MPPTLKQTAGSAGRCGQAAKPLGTCSRSVASDLRLAREAQPYMGTASIAGPRSGRAV